MSFNPAPVSVESKKRILLTKGEGHIGPYWEDRTQPGPNKKSTTREFDGVPSINLKSK